MGDRVSEGGRNERGKEVRERKNKKRRQGVSLGVCIALGEWVSE